MSYCTNIFDDSFEWCPHCNRVRKTIGINSAYAWHCNKCFTKFRKIDKDWIKVKKYIIDGDGNYNICKPPKITKEELVDLMI